MAGKGFLSLEAPQLAEVLASDRLAVDSEEEVRRPIPAAVNWPTALRPPTRIRSIACTLRPHACPSPTQPLRTWRQVYNAVLYWVRHDVAARRGEMEALLRHVRLGLLPAAALDAMEIEDEPTAAVVAACPSLAAAVR